MPKMSKVPKVSNQRIQESESRGAYGAGLTAKGMAHNLKFKVSSMKMRLRLVKQLGTLNMEL